MSTLEQFDPSMRRAHFIGIGGIGMSALARLLLDEGWSITGSDLHPSPLTDALAVKGARIYNGHAAEHLGDPDLVVITAAIRPDNPELTAANQKGIRVLKRSELLGRLMAGKRGVAIAGTHGKTTTTALTALALLQGGLDPTVFVGGEVRELGGNFRKGAGQVLIAEADEFDGSFLQLSPEIAAVTNVEPEHLDFYGDFTSLVGAFAQFLASVPQHGAIVYNLDDPVLARLLGALPRSVGQVSNLSGQDEILLHRFSAGPLAPNDAPSPHRPIAVSPSRTISYGFHPEARWRPQYLAPNEQGGHDYLALLDGAPFAEISLRIPGRHNVSNSLAAVAIAHLFDIPGETVQRAFAQFEGVKRRFQVIGSEAGVTVVDDYAHHPTEVRATLAAARIRYPGRPIHCLFQPHTYSRTRLLMALFADAFQDAGQVWITDIYAAREENHWDVTSQELAASIHHPAVKYVGSLQQAISHLPAVLLDSPSVIPNAPPVILSGAKNLEGGRGADSGLKNPSTELRTRLEGGRGGAGPILLTMGAGDINTAGPAILAALANLRNGASSLVPHPSSLAPPHAPR